ncbi:hypothetical protein MHX53_00210 [Brevibacterium sp. ACRRH]|uniref:hypothetical protein n=1 Tax=Brevibacterium sp. ACRRH TaxID=2918183 RepID=UPI001EF6FFF1|nr:hypothetical protein [Brevibacterium sp. ACRRH]MCG7297482.1 hypothetical protein [Brevibacterium sp. ACRRH]
MRDQFVPFRRCRKGLAKLELEKGDTIRVPSEFNAFNVQSMLPRRYDRRVEVASNMINDSEFTPTVTLSVSRQE